MFTLASYHRDGHSTMVAIEDRHLGFNVGRIPVSKGVWYFQAKVTW